MPNPAKPIAQVMADGKKHLTKAEIEQRQKAEKALATGKPLKMRSELSSNKIAKREFKRVNELLSIIGKNDALVEGSVNRYAELTAECAEFCEKRDVIAKGIEQLEDFYSKEECKDEEKQKLHKAEYFQLLTKMEGSMINLDKQIMSKRKMLFDIEKENLMTIASQLRSIPKTVDDTAEDDDGMSALLSGG